MRLGLVSDTHDNALLSRVAAAFFQEKACDLVLHLGDVTEPETADLFAGLPMRFLLGNNDDPREIGASLARNGFPPPAEDWSERLDGVLVAAHHGHRRPRLPHGEPDLLVHGHTHRYRATRVGRTHILNPGALHRAPRKTLALVELPAVAVSFFEVTPEGVLPLRGP